MSIHDTSTSKRKNRSTGCFSAGFLILGLLVIVFVGVGFFIIQSMNTAFNNAAATFSPDGEFSAFAGQVARSVALTKAAGGSNSQEQQLFDDYGIKTAPLADGTDPTHFDSIAALRQVQAFVGDGSELISMQAQYVRPDGTMDLNAQYSPSPNTVYKFILKLKATPTNAPPVGAGGGDGTFWYDPVKVTVHHPGDTTDIQSGINSVAYDNKGMESETDSATNDSYRAVPAPTCAFTQLWKTAISKGAPENAVSTIIYDYSGYEFAMYDIGFFARFDTHCALTSVEGPRATDTPEPR